MATKPFGPSETPDAAWMLDVGPRAPGDIAARPVPPLPLTALEKLAEPNRTRSSKSGNVPSVPDASPMPPIPKFPYFCVAKPPHITAFKCVQSYAPAGRCAFLGDHGRPLPSSRRLTPYPRPVPRATRTTNGQRTGTGKAASCRWLMRRIARQIGVAGPAGLRKNS